jgi:hypothetical protein
VRESQGDIWKIVVPVVVALLVGGSAPWWWDKAFPPAYKGTPASSPATPLSSGGVPSASSNAGRLSLPARLESLFYPSGWMGDGRLGTKYFRFQYTQDTIESRSVVVAQLSYQPGPDGWAGIYWQYPDGNWGDLPGRSLVGAREIAFLARGLAGGEIVEFKSGGIREKLSDSYETSLGKVVLTSTWTQHRIDLAQADLSSVIGAFAVVIAAADNRHQDVSVELAELEIR